MRRRCASPSVRGRAPVAITTVSACTSSSDLSPHPCASRHRARRTSRAVNERVGRLRLAAQEPLRKEDGGTDRADRATRWRSGRCLPPAIPSTTLRQRGRRPRSRSSLLLVCATGHEHIVSRCRSFLPPDGSRGDRDAARQCAQSERPAWSPSRPTRSRLRRAPSLSAPDTSIGRRRRRRAPGARPRWRAAHRRSRQPTRAADRVEDVREPVATPRARPERCRGRCCERQPFDRPAPIGVPAERALAAEEREESEAVRPRVAPRSRWCRRRGACEAARRGRCRRRKARPSQNRALSTR